MTQSDGHKIDYITATCPSYVKNVELLLLEEGQLSQVGITIGGAEYIGESMVGKEGHMAVLRNPDRGVLVQMSGLAASRHWGQFLDGRDWRWSRVDICLDIRVDINLRKWYEMQLLLYPRMKCSLIGTETMYVGSRKSERFWRIYNKSVQMGANLTPPLWRIEVELKGERARQAQALVGSAGLSDVYMHSAIGVVEDILAFYGHYDVGGELDLSIPRKPRAGLKFLEKSVLPFLRRNPWAVDHVMREFKEDGDM